MTHTATAAPARIVVVSGGFAGSTGIAYGPTLPSGLGEHRTLVRLDGNDGAIPVLTANIRLA